MRAPFHLTSFLLSCLATTALATAAQAADLAAPPAPVAPPVLATGFFQGVEFHAQGEVGILGNPANPSQGFNGEGYNFGDLYTDHANTPLLNQILLTITKPVDPKATGYAFGFTVQGLYGSDERFNHLLGIGEAVIKDRNQIGLLQAFGAAHLPILTAGGVDLKVGVFASPQGYETTDPSASPFYSHSFTYNYAVTFEHTGILTTTHISPALDFYLGVDTGNQTTFGVPIGDPNGQPAGFVGFGLNNLLNDKLTVLALSHIGPEQSYFVDPNAGKDLRYYNDVVFTYKISDKLTSVLELNYLLDEYGFGNGPAYSYSGVGYLGYALDSHITLNARGEVFRDAQNFDIATFQDPLGLVKTQQGIVAPFPPNLVAPNGTQGTTYGSITLGVTYKPDVPKPLALVALRPEIRYERVIAGGPAFNNNMYLGGFNGSRNQFTFGGDLIVGF